MVDQRKNNKGKIGNAGGRRTLGAISRSIKSHGDARVIRSVTATDDEYEIIRRILSAIKQKPELKADIMRFLEECCSRLVSGK